MSRLGRLLLALTAMALAVGGFASPSFAQDEPTTTEPTAETGAPETPSGDPAIDDLVGCVQGSRRLVVLFLIDESASLKVSDPDNRRVDAARGALDSLVALSTAEGDASPSVDVALAAFSNDYRLVKDWTAAGADTADSLNSALDEFAEFNNGIDTDFVNALSTGRVALADQAAAVTAEGGATPCRAVIMFTDGGYDLAVRESAEDQERLGTTKPYAPGIELTTPEDVLRAEQLGRKALCDPGQLADRLRSDDVTMLTVALSGDVARRSQLPLAAATTGKADDYPCGTQPEDGETTRTKGAYLPAEDIDVLVTQFNGVGTRLAGGNLVPGSDEVEVCGEQPCDEGTRSFELDKSIRRAQILTLAPEPGTVVQIDGPKGATAQISEAGSSTVGATDVETREVAGRGYAIDLTRPSDLESWNGEWKVSILDPSEAQAGDAATIQIFVFSDIGVAFSQVLPLERGTSSTITAALTLPEGVKAEDVIASTTASVRLRNPVTGAIDTVELSGPPAGPFVGSYATPADTTSNALEATAEVRITTTTAALLLSQSPPTELLVRRPAGSIQFAPGSLKMPSLTGEGSTEIELVVIGGDKPGCVWFGTVDVPDPPDGTSGVTVTQNGEPLPGETQCIAIPAKQQVPLTIAVSPDGRGSGAVRGTIQIFERTDEGAEPSVTQVPFRFDLARGVDQAERLLLSLLLLVLGLGLPMLALLVINAITARFQTLDAVRGAAVPVLVSGKSIQRTDGPYPRALTLRETDFGSMAQTGNAKSFRFGGVEFRARASRNPFGATIAMAVPEGGAEKLKGRAGSRVELDPALSGSWVFLLDPDKTRKAALGDAEGLLIAFVAEGDVNNQTNRMMPDIIDRLPDTASRLAGLVRQVKRKPASTKKHGKGDQDPIDAPIDEAPAEDLVDPSAESADAQEDGTAPMAMGAGDVDEPVAFTGLPEAMPLALTAGSPDDDGDDESVADERSGDDDPPAPPLGFSGIRPGS